MLFNFFLIIMTPIQEQFHDIMSRHAFKVPIIFQLPSDMEKQIKKKKLLVDYYFTVAEIIFWIRKTIRSVNGYGNYLPANEGIYLMVNDKILKGNDTFYSVWDKKSFLIVKICKESTFG